MNISIICESKNLNFSLKNLKANSSLKVRDLVSNLKKNIKLENGYNIFLIEESRRLEDTEEIKIKDENEVTTRTFFLIEVREYKLKNQILNDSELEENLMKVTNAKEKLNRNRTVKKTRRIHDDSLTREFELFEQILQSSQNSNMDAVDRLNAIRNLIMRPVIGENQTNINNSNVNQSHNSLASNLLNTMSQMTNNTSQTNNQNQSQVNSNPFYIPQRIRPQIVQPEPELINNLTEMGFEEDRARRALIATSNDYAAAAEMLLNDTDIALGDDLPSGMYNYSYGGTGNIELPQVNNNELIIDPENEEEFYDEEEGNNPDEHI